MNMLQSSLEGVRTHMLNRIPVGATIIGFTLCLNNSNKIITLDRIEFKSFHSAFVSVKPCLVRPVTKLISQRKNFIGKNSWLMINLFSDSFGFWTQRDAQRRIFKSTALQQKKCLSFRKEILFIHTLDCLLTFRGREMSEKIKVEKTRACCDKKKWW